MKMVKLPEHAETQGVSVKGGTVSTGSSLQLRELRHKLVAQSAGSQWESWRKRELCRLREGHD